MDEKVIQGLVTLIPHLLSRITPYLPPEERWRTGGWICVMDTSTDPYGRVVLHQRIGEVPDDKMAKYKMFALEKAQRLIRYPDHRTSYQSRNEDAEQYGGAIRLKECIIAFSGLPERWDEALVLSAAWLHELTDATVFHEVRDEVTNCFNLMTRGR